METKDRDPDKTWVQVSHQNPRDNEMRVIGLEDRENSDPSADSLQKRDIIDIPPLLYFDA